MAMKSKQFLWLLSALGAFIFIEPAPYDILVAALVLVYFITGRARFPSHLLLPSALLWVFLLTNLIPLLAYQDNDSSRAIFYGAVTFYLVVSWLFFASAPGLSCATTWDKVDIIFKGYLFGVIINILMGLPAFFTQIPWYDVVIKYGRLKGFFKDPNVFAPYLVPVMLYSIYRISTSKGGRTQLTWLGVIIILTLGLLLAASRAAWLNAFVSVLLFCWIGLRGGQRLRLSLWAIVAMGILVFWLSINPIIVDLIEGRLGLQPYDAERFSTQARAFETALGHPLGIGPGHAEVIFEYATHSLYMRLIAENGWIGAITFMIFLFASWIRTLKGSLMNSDNSARPYFSIIMGSLAGMMVNSAFIDSLHWRHMWLILALAWLPFRKNTQANTPPKPDLKTKSYNSPRLC